MNSKRTGSNNQAIILIFIGGNLFNFRSLVEKFTEIRRFPLKNIPACLPFHPYSVLDVSAHRTTMHENTRPEYEIEYE